MLVNYNTCGTLGAQNAILVIMWNMEVRTVTGMGPPGCSECYSGGYLLHGVEDSNRNLISSMLGILFS